MNDYLNSIYTDIEKGMEESDELCRKVDEEINILNLMEKQQGVGCWCQNCCIEETGLYNMFRMVVCPQCGNKRCPRASNHLLECTGSNEPGQEGSIYV